MTNCQRSPSRINCKASIQPGITLLSFMEAGRPGEVPSNTTPLIATPNIVNTVVLRSRLELPNSGTPATAIILNAGTIAQVNIASAHILNVVWQNGTLGNYLRIYKVILRQVD